jgi:hypothetical protein
MHTWDNGSLFACQVDVYCCWIWLNCWSLFLFAFFFLFVLSYWSSSLSINCISRRFMNNEAAYLTIIMKFYLVIAIWILFPNNKSNQTSEWSLLTAQQLTFDICRIDTWTSLRYSFRSKLQMIDVSQLSALIQNSRFRVNPQNSLLSSSLWSLSAKLYSHSHYIGVVRRRAVISSLGRRKCALKFDISRWTVTFSFLLFRRITKVMTFALRNHIRLPATTQQSMEIAMLTFNRQNRSYCTIFEIRTSKHPVYSWRLYLWFDIANLAHSSVGKSPISTISKTNRPQWLSLFPSTQNFLRSSIPGYLVSSDVMIKLPSLW